MNEIKIFENEQFGQVRIINQDGEAWFVAADVCRVLELSNPSMAIARLDVDERAKFNLGPQGLGYAVNKPGLYALILGSRKPEAKAFKRWITHEVIPAIEKHGMYATPETAEKILNDPDFLIQALESLKAEREARMHAEEKIALDAPKVLFADSVAQADNEILIGELAKLLKQNGYETGQNRLFNQLRKDGFIMKNSTIPTQKAMEQGLFRVIERTVVPPNGTTRITQTTKVTGKGQIYFVNRYCGKQ